MAEVFLGVIMRLAILLLLGFMAGCTSSRKDNLVYSGPTKVNDFYFEVLEIKSSMHKDILDRKPWIALAAEPADNWSLGQISEWLSLQYSKDVEKAKLKLLKSHLNTADPKSAYTKDIEEMCWTEVERLIKSQLIKTAVVVSNKAKLSPNRPIQKIIHDSLAAHTPKFAE